MDSVDVNDFPLYFYNIKVDITRRLKCLEARLKMCYSKICFFEMCYVWNFNL